ncbi:uncharacterized protein C14orf119 homolog [Ischnura elegans]|uniref:uncharacterized protein C14orf119 homolog n=1 Tax=Ischnura elegans TaxID=197161 RepID=UPI001ED8A9B9|nr:uncharacterized protein C14orf119 homolog [Ischnura elegans]
MGSNDRYPVPAQIRFMLLWFKEWSEMQRGDFLPILAQKFSPPGSVNGVVAGVEGLNCHQSDRPPSLFQCRVKLFGEWVTGWSQADKDQFLSGLKEVDPQFVENYEAGFHIIVAGQGKKDSEEEKEDVPVATTAEEVETEEYLGEVV